MVYKYIFAYMSYWHKTGPESPGAFGTSNRVQGPEHVPTYKQDKTNIQVCLYNHHINGSFMRGRGMEHLSIFQADQSFQES